MTTERIPMTFASRVIATRGRRTAPQRFYLRETFELDIPSVGKSDAPQVLEAVIGNGYREGHYRRRLWEDRTYCQVHWQQPPTLDLVRELLGRSPRDVSSALAPWIGNPVEPLFQYPNSEYLDFNDAVVLFPRDISTIVEDARDATAARLHEIAREGLLFVDGVLYHARPLPAWDIRMPPVCEKGGTALKVADYWSAQHPDFGFALPLDRREEAVAILAGQGVDPGIWTSQFDIRCAAPGVFARTRQAVPNALAGILLYSRLIVPVFPDLNPEAILAVSRLNALGDALKRGEMGRIHDILREFERLSDENFYLPVAAGERLRKCQSVWQMTRDLILASGDLPTSKPEIAADADETLNLLRI